MAQLTDDTGPQLRHWEHGEPFLAPAELCPNCLPWHPILSRMRLDHPDDHPDDHSGSVWTDGASNVSRLDPSGAVWFEPSIRLVVEAHSARRSVRGGQNLSARRVGNNRI